jgi:hypothetical protein
MCPETVIRLRRTLFGLRESRFQGAYCAYCRISVVLGADNAPLGMPDRTARKTASAGLWTLFRALPRSGSMAKGSRHAHYA